VRAAVRGVGFFSPYLIHFGASECHVTYCNCIHVPIDLALPSWMMHFTLTAQKYHVGHRWDRRRCDYQNLLLIIIITMHRLTRAPEALSSKVVRARVRFLAVSHEWIMGVF